MKKPNIKNLKENKSETKRIRSAISQSKSIKITINIDAEVLAKLREMADETGIPYQRLINRTLADGVAEKQTFDSRLKRLEKELKAIKKSLVA